MDFFVDLLRGTLGITVLLGTCYLLSNNRKGIDWRLVGSGMLLQIALALLILKVPYVNVIFDYIAKGFQQILSFTEAGAQFLFGSIVQDMGTFGYIFAFQVLPTIVFFSALSAMLYYFGILQKVVYGLSWLMSRTMGLSGPESLAAAANVFIGQTEAPLVIKPYLEGMSKSEMLCLMTGGMATIAGGVFAAYVGYLGGEDPVQQVYFAKHLLTASIISAPAAIVAAKMLFPEEEKKSITEQTKMMEDPSNNLLDAISRGTTDGLKLAINVGAMLLVFTALIYMLNVIFMSVTDGINMVAIEAFGNQIGDWNESIKLATNGRFEGFTFTYLLGVLFAPVAWILGTPTVDITVVGQLLGQKTVVNEFLAYAELNTLREAGVNFQPKSLIIATYALCGFANFASIGIQIGGIGAIAPGQRKALTELGIKALIGGTIASFLTAAIAGVLI
ncbi:MAG: nucleoside transporter NupC [Saprospiraceae bacterium]|nr:MAG: nucleoside transporter NupC [Saprospiraceae bacterium]